ncbi:glycosyltransferase family 2 protein [Pararhodonellum marinum]|uniref:glycosyltransferase family 2 protein n=1 Tax=Pararhodonellum marinum TaxID=2755358 RepID=UPI00188E782B|nr:glycosyltransferase family 2 protein [Pararhodonellum marinum]
MPNIKERSLSIIIPNYNGEKLLQEYLPYTFRAVQVQNIPYEIIVVDDASTDNSAAILKKCFPSVKIIESTLNEGFSKACNKGIAAATMSYSFLLNSDIQLTERYFDALWKYVEMENSFGVMGTILQPDGSVEISEKSMFLKGLTLKIKNKKSHSKKPLLTTFLSGANALVHTDKIKHLNGFDPIFSPFYSEDVDLSLRAWRMGWECYLEPKSICYHLGSSSIGNHFERSYIKEIYFRNRMILNAIHTTDLTRYQNSLLVSDILPKLLIGKAWIWKSYKGFRKQNQAILKSRGNLKKILKKNPQSNSLEEIIQKLSKQQEINFKNEVSLGTSASLT